MVVDPAPTSSKKHDLFVSLVDETVSPPQLRDLQRLLQLTLLGFCDARSQHSNLCEAIGGRYLLVFKSFELGCGGCEAGRALYHQRGLLRGVEYGAVVPSVVLDL